MPGGRPKGAKNKKPSMTPALKAAIPGGRQHFRPDQEFFQGTKHVTMNMDAVSHGCLSIHARRRHIPLSWLIQDVLNLWLAASTDYDQAIFRELLPPKARAARTPERFVGYIESLGFAPAPAQTPTSQANAANTMPQTYMTDITGAHQAHQAHQAHDDTPLAQAPQYQAEPLTPVYNDPTNPNRPTTKTIADLATPWRHPSTLEGPAAYPHPAPSIPHNAGVFDPAQQPKTPGRGSAAQDVETGSTAGQDELPPIDHKLQEMLDFYRVDPKDIR